MRQRVIEAVAKLRFPGSLAQAFFRAQCGDGPLARRKITLIGRIYLKSSFVPLGGRTGSDSPSAQVPIGFATAPDDPAGPSALLTSRAPPCLRNAQTQDTRTRLILSPAQPRAWLTFDNRAVLLLGSTHISTFLPREHPWSELCLLRFPPSFSLRQPWRRASPGPSQERSRTHPTCRSPARR